MTPQNARLCIATFFGRHFHSAQQHNHRVPWGPLKLNTAVTISSLIPIPSKVAAAHIHTASLRLILMYRPNIGLLVFFFFAQQPALGQGHLINEVSR
jgi:hypothetical protein